MKVIVDIADDIKIGVNEVSFKGEVIKEVILTHKEMKINNHSVVSGEKVIEIVTDVINALNEKLECNK